MLSSTKLLIPDDCCRSGSEPDIDLDIIGPWAYSRSAPYEVFGWTARPSAGSDRTALTWY